MDFEDFFEKKNKYHKKQVIHDYHQDDNDRNKSYATGYGSFNPLKFINSLKNNKQLKIILIIAIIIIVVVIVGVLALFFPLIIKSINYIAQNGVSGVLDEVINFLNRLWSGTK